MYNPFFHYIDDSIKVRAFDVLDVYSNNRRAFDGLSFTEQFRELLNMMNGNDDDDELLKAIDAILTLEQRRVNSYSQGNTRIEDYKPAQVPHWTEH